MKLHISQIFCALAISMAFTEATADTLYKCEKPSGKIQYQGTPCVGMSTVSKKVISTAASPSESNETAASVIIPPDANGSYATMATLNGQPINMKLMMGSGDVSLPTAIADKIGVKCSGATRTFASVLGSAEGCDTVIPSVQIGSFKFTNVSAYIFPKSTGAPILGTSSLKGIKAELSPKRELTLSGIKDAPPLK
ncbi:MAG: retropepsin-like aspartic protease [Gallionella sp.]|jgi:aspartyl protease family protein